MVQKVGRKQTYKTVRASSRSKRTNWGNNQAPRKFERYPFAKISRFLESKTFLLEINTVLKNPKSNAF